MPGKAMPVKPNPKKMRAVAVASGSLKVRKATKGADKVGNKFIPDFTKPKGNRLRLLEQINEMNKRKP